MMRYGAMDKDLKSGYLINFNKVEQMQTHGVI